MRSVCTTSLLLQAFDQIKPDLEPLPKHSIIFLNQDTRELYASVLAVVLLCDGQVSEPQVRLFGMLLRSMQLDAPPAKFFEMATAYNINQVQAILKRFDHPDLKSALILDVMFLIRSAAVVSQVKLQVLVALCRAFKLSTEQVDCLVALCRYGFALEAKKAGDLSVQSARYVDFLQRKIHPIIAEKYNQQNMHDVASGVWVDPKTGLMWSRICIGQEWQDGEAKGKAKYMNWDDAHEACKDLFLEGFNDWRLPNKQELESLTIEGREGYNAPDGVLYAPTLSSPQQFGSVWSATTNDPYTMYAWVIRFDQGVAEVLLKGYSCRVRAVRGGLSVT